MINRSIVVWQPQLASALYLLEDLKCKLDVAFAKKRPAFLAASKPAGPTPSGLPLLIAFPFVYLHRTLTTIVRKLTLTGCGDRGVIRLTVRIICLSRLPVKYLLILIIYLFNNITSKRRVILKLTFNWEECKYSYDNTVMLDPCY
jgi:hypothetical protein